MYNQTVLPSATETNKVLSETYKLLSASLFWSGIVATISTIIGVPPMGMVGLVVFLLAYFGLLFLIEKNKNNSKGIFLVFAFTGLLGFTLAPMLGFVIGAGKGGLIVTSLLGTGAVFFITSFIGKNTKKDLSGIANIVFPVILIGFVMGLVNAFVLQSPIISNVLSIIFLITSSFLITWQTNNIVKGGETNYITATVVLFVALYNIFSSLLQLALLSDD